MSKPPITIKTIVHASLKKVWECWTQPTHIDQWAFASNDWEAIAKVNDLRVGRAFKTVMRAKDLSTSFDFEGIYSDVQELSRIEYDLADARHVKIEFVETPDGVEVTQTFDPENENPIEMQRDGWQAFLDNFKKHVESKDYIDKLAYIHIVDKKVLVTLSKGKDTWYIPGGKREAGESDVQALVREVREELQVDLIENTIKKYGVFEAQAHGKPEGTVVRMTCYTAEYQGTIMPDSEIDKVDYFGFARKSETSPVDHLIFDDLLAKGMIE